MFVLLAQCDIGDPLQPTATRANILFSHIIAVDRHSLVALRFQQARTASGRTMCLTQLPAS